MRIEGNETMHAPIFPIRHLVARCAARPDRMCMFLLLVISSAWPAVANAGPDLAPNSDTECVRGGSCLIEVAIENKGDLQFEGATGLRGFFEPAVTVESVSAETRKLKCDVTGEGTYECTGSALSIEPRDAAGIQIVIDIPDDFGSETIIHTNEMVWPDETVINGNTENDRHVSNITVIDPAMLPAVDLAIANTAVQGTCTAGQPCSFALTATNNGPATFDGTILISDSTDLLATRLISSNPSDWSCNETNGRVTCTLADTTLPAGESRSLELTIATASFLSGTLTNCAEVSRGAKVLVRDVQRALNEAGYNAGLIDGIAGRRTRAAVSAFQETNGLTVTGEIGAELTEKLFGAEKPSDTEPDNDRACATAELIAPPEEEPAVQPDQPADMEQRETSQ